MKFFIGSTLLAGILMLSFYGEDLSLKVLLVMYVMMLSMIYYMYRYEKPHIKDKNNNLFKWEKLSDDKMIAWLDEDAESYDIMKIDKRLIGKPYKSKRWFNLLSSKKEET